MKQPKRQFKQLTIEERETIQELLQAGASMREIGRHLGRPHTTIARELRIHGSFVTGRYTPRLAQERTELMRLGRGQRPRLKNQLIRNYVEKKLKEDWSPEQISGRLQKDHPAHSISTEAIYLYIYSRCERQGWGVEVKGEDLRVYLRRKHKRRNRKNRPWADGRGHITNRVSIDQRPKYIEKRRQLGHWEGDSIVSRRSYAGLNTLVERATGVVKISKLQNIGSAETARVVINQLQKLPITLRRTLTTDNGHENACHQAVGKEVNLQWYFCHAYASHERGTNENTNGLIRQYFPKKTDFATVSEEEIQFVEDRLNNRPRKRLKYKTPNEVFNRPVVH